MLDLLTTETFNFKKTVLENGLRVVTETHNWAKTVHVGFFIECGTKHELEGQTGMAHFTEHMVFKGTEHKSALDLVLDIEKAGADINAHTSREYTCFTTTGLKDSLPLCLNTLSDLVFHADFKAEEFEREKGVVIQEIDMSKDNLEDHIFDLFFELTFPGHPVSRNILGTKKSLNKISRQDLVSYYDECFQTSKMIISAAGPISHDEFVDLVRRQGLDQKQKAKPKQYPEVLQLPPLKSKSYNEWQARPSEQAHLVIGLPSVSFLDKHRFEAYVLSSYLGGGMTSRLYQVIREQKGWAYNVYTYLQSFLEGGSLAVYIGSAPENVNAILKILDDEFSLLLKNGISLEDLNLYKTQVKASIVMGMDDLESRMNSIGINEMIFKKYRSAEDVIYDLDQISIESFNSMLPRILIPEQMSILCMGETRRLVPTAMDEFKNFKWGFL